MTVRAAFAFRNQGGAVATGVRVRFNLPEGLVYLVGSGQLDGSDLDDELGNSPLISRSGAHIGDVAPGDERRIEISYSVAGAIENGTTIELQAAVASFELSPVGSNVVRLIARSKPQLANALTRISIEARQDAVPGSEAQITVRMHNAGESSAHDVVVVSPIPEHTTYVAGSARVNGREIERDLGISFDRMYAPTVSATLPASASATLVYRVRIDAPLPDGTRIVALAQIASQETASFALEPASLVVRATPDFGDDRTTFTVEPSHEVRPGQRVVLALAAYNAGTSAAENVTANIELPETLILVRGASGIDGRAVRERRKETLAFDLGRIDAGERVELRTEAVVTSPLADGAALDVAGILAWEPAGDDAVRRFERTVAVRSEPSLPQRRNALARVGGEDDSPQRRTRSCLLTRQRRQRRGERRGAASARRSRARRRARIRKERALVDRRRHDRSRFAGSLRAAQARSARARALAVCRPQRSARRRERAYARARGDAAWRSDLARRLASGLFRRHLQTGTRQRRDAAAQPACGRRHRAGQRRNRRRAQRALAALRIARSAPRKRRRCDPREVVARLRRDPAGRECESPSRIASAAQPCKRVSGYDRRGPHRRRHASRSSRAPDDRHDGRARFFGRDVPQRTDRRGRRRRNGRVGAARAQRRRRPSPARSDYDRPAGDAHLRSQLDDRQRRAGTRHRRARAVRDRARHRSQRRRSGSRGDDPLARRRAQRTSGRRSDPARRARAVRRRAR